MDGARVAGSRRGGGGAGRDDCGGGARRDDWSAPRAAKRPERGARARRRPLARGRAGGRRGSPRRRPLRARTPGRCAQVWMKATVTDGEGATYASGRALFVAPNLGRAFLKGIRGAGAGAAAAAGGGGEASKHQPAAA
jgi:hypothetical protein